MPLITPSHTIWTNISNTNAGPVLSSQIASDENPISYNGFRGTPNTPGHLAFVAGDFMNTAVRTTRDFLYSLARTVKYADTVLQFPVAEAASSVARAASAPLFRLDGRVLRVDELPESLEHEPEVIKLHDPDYRISESSLKKSRVHKMVARQLEKFIGKKEVRKLRALIVSDHNHNSGRSKLLHMHLKRLAIKGEIVLLSDGQTIGKEKQDVQSSFDGVNEAGLYHGLEADLPITLTNLINVHHVLFTQESVPSSNINKGGLAKVFRQLLYSFTESDAYQEAQKNFEKDFRQSSKKDRALLAPFIHELSSIPPGTDVQSGCDKLAEWYINASAGDRGTARLFLKRMVSQLVKSLDGEHAHSILAYLDDPQKKFDKATKTVMDLRKVSWEKVIKDTWVEVDKKAQESDEEPKLIVVFEGRAHDKDVDGVLSELKKNAEKPKVRMRSEL